MNILYKVTAKLLLKNKTRTIVTIIGVALTSALLFGVGFFASTLREEALRMEIEANGPQHVVFHELNTSELKIIENSKSIDKIFTKALVLEESNYDLTDKTNEIYNTNKETLSEHFNLSVGEYPKNNNEIIISRNYAADAGVTIGGSLTTSKKEYKIVGVYDESILDTYKYNSFYNFSNYKFYTTNETSDLFDVYVMFNKPSKTKEEVTALAQKLGLGEKLQHIDGEYQIVYDKTMINYSVIKYYGGISNYGAMAIFILSIMLILSILSIACILIIYNSFSISVTERKRMFGILSSIGSTPAQKLKSVFFEATIISLIGIPLGFLIGLGVVSSIIFILNNILEVVIDNPFKISIYPLFVLISLFFIIIMVFLSALFPAKRASETTPIDAIRLMQDIKYNRKKIRTSKLVRKLFGFEAVLALKNIKRNKKRYRITVISLCVSIILFITTSTFTGVALKQIKNPNNPHLGLGSQSDIFLEVEIDQEDDFIKDIKSIDDINDYLDLFVQTLFFKYPDQENFTEEFVSVYEETLMRSKGGIILVYSMNNEDYNDYIAKLRLENNNPIFINRVELTYSDPDQGLVKKHFDILKPLTNLEIKLCDKDIINFINANCYHEFNNVNLINDDSLGLRMLTTQSLVVNKELFDELSNHFNHMEPNSLSKPIRQFRIKADNPALLDKEISRVIEKYPELDIYYQNQGLEIYILEMAILGIRFSLYSIIFFITIISVTSVINNINTSTRLRRREFAVLRSVGLSPNGFNKMIRFESVFFGLKSLLYGVPISLGIIHLISQIFLLDYTKRFNVPINYFEILIVILVVVIVSFITMMYAVRKIKKENILDGIRNENI